MPAKLLPSVEYLRQCFDYDALSGMLTWRQMRPREHFKTVNGYRKWSLYYAGTTAGRIDKSGHYARVAVGGNLYKVHRIIWKMQTGQEPPLEIDHRNGDHADNRWDNLRAATRSQNTWNAARNTPGKTLPKGVFAHIINGRQEGRCFAMAYRHGKRFYLGRFDTVAEADAAYRAFTAQTDGEFHHPD